MKTLKFATSNKNKLKEASMILGINIEQIDIELDEIQTINVEELIRHKAMQAYAKTGESVIVEDTGLGFVVWNGLPGALIKWFLVSVGNEGILKMLEGYSNREAIAVCYIAMYDGKDFIISKGEIKGKISEIPKGENGFGWDKIFIPIGSDKTYAEMSQEEKNDTSMRRIAFEKFKEYI